MRLGFGLGFNRRRRMSSTPPATATFGALTLAGAGAIPAPGVSSITNAGGTNLVLSGGNLVPDTGGTVTSGTVTYDTGATTVVTAEADTYTVITTAEADAALTASHPTGGKTLKFRSGTNTIESTTRLAKNESFTSPMVITGEAGAILSGAMAFENAGNVTIQDLEFYQTGATSGAIISFIGGCADITIQDNTIHGQYYDPLGDYSVAGSYQNCDGINTSAGASAASFAGTIRRNKFYDLSEGVVLDVGGAVSVIDNEIYHTYSDCMKMTVTGTGLTAVKEFSRNVCHSFVGDPADADNPHVDVLQFLSGAANDGLDMTNLTIRQNVAWVDDTVSRGRGIQGIVAFTDGGYNVVMKDPVVAGNVMLLDASHHINFYDVDGGTFVNNTLCHPSPTYAETGAANLKMGSVASAGSIDARNNVCDGYTLSGAATYDTTGNVTLGVKGATIAYSTEFDGSTFAPSTFAEVKTEFDVASGTAGALGSGYGVYGSVRDGTGWSYDSSYEAAAYSQSLVDTQGTAGLSAAAGVGGNEAAFTLSVWLKTQVQATATIMSVSGRSYITMNSDGSLDVVLKDTLNSERYNANSSANDLPVGTLVHVYVAADFANDTLDIKIDGAAPTMTVAVSSFTGGSGLVDLDRAMVVVGSPLDVHIADLSLYNSIVSNASLYNGGTPPDPTTIGSPLVLMTGAASVWNAGTNAGSAGNLTVDSATFADV